MICRVKGKGHESLNGVAGDLMVQVWVQPDEKFSRIGYDLHSEKEITVSQAILGGQCQIDTISGMKTLNIDPGTHDGHQVKIS